MPKGSDQRTGFPPHVAQAASEASVSPERLEELIDLARISYGRARRVGYAAKIETVIDGIRLETGNAAT